MITVRETSLTGETLEAIREIDLEFYPNIGQIDWYLARYKPWHSAFAAMDGGKMVGYFVAVPVRKELYDAIVNGVLVDDLGVSPDTSLSMIISKSMSLQMTLFCSFYGLVLFHCAYIPHLFYPFICL